MHVRCSPCCLPACSPHRPAGLSHARGGWPVQRPPGLLAPCAGLLGAEPSWPSSPDASGLLAAQPCSAAPLGRLARAGPRGVSFVGPCELCQPTMASVAARARDAESPVPLGRAPAADAAGCRLCCAAARSPRRAHRLRGCLVRRTKF